jgi:hypothetical protein
MKDGKHRYMLHKLYPNFLSYVTDCIEDDASNCMCTRYRGNFFYLFPSNDRRGTHADTQTGGIYEEAIEMAQVP